jgi:hypothetical protein
LEIQEEIQTLTAEELFQRAEMQKELSELYEADELFWYSRSSADWLLKGDNTIEFFHRIANGKKIKKIQFLDCRVGS